ncbi:MAG TPA: hypothetical protein VHT05_05925 [Candidatus Elarobacter sp.]|nr:hypothetical protein [Candidatus Elarobacter sp.]
MNVRGSAVPAALALVLALTGCHSSTGTVTPASTLSNVTGDYTGTVTDATAGVQNATLTLSEHGSAVGGALLLGATGATTIALALTLETSNAMNGSGTMDTTGVACTFTVTGTYDPTANTYDGSYAPVGTCATMTGGTFTLAQQCMDAPSAERRRGEGLLAHC